MGFLRHGTTMKLPSTDFAALVALVPKPNLTAEGRLCYSSCMTETLTIRLPKSLAREFRAKTRAARTNPTEVLRQAAALYVRADQTARHAIVEHIRARAGT